MTQVAGNHVKQDAPAKKSVNNSNPYKAMSAQNKNKALLKAVENRAEDTEKVILLLEALADIETQNKDGALP